MAWQVNVFKKNDWWKEKHDSLSVTQNCIHKKKKPQSQNKTSMNENSNKAKTLFLKTHIHEQKIHEVSIIKNTRKLTQKDTGNFSSCSSKVNNTLWISPI